MRGRFITFEGGEGAGKSTQISFLAAALEAQGLPVLQTREPGGSPGAEEIRGLLVRGEAGRWDGVSETLLLYAARRNHLQTVILPALEQGRWVLCDRFNDSTLAYQGYGRGLAMDWLDSLYQAVSEGLQPDLTLYIDVPVEVGLARAGRRGDDENRFEGLADSFHLKIRRGFQEIVRNNPDRCATIDGMGSVDEIRRVILETVLSRLPHHGR
ncbi:dTMP kinase [Novispirillum itersonii]|uniref:Thymidylate kinase n=1 Tax=Novispirillum itersonii TaxID=189 RepID=A0A7W9ZEJ4_NOVIT|nr:dTMP kinase [Novispirillum itersonii]MBB6210021.1 dTMP kinase [Novispirillum itersonii]